MFWKKQQNQSSCSWRHTDGILTRHNWSFSIPPSFAKAIRSICWGWSCGIAARNCFPGCFSRAGLHNLYTGPLSFLLSTWMVVKNIWQKFVVFFLKWWEALNSGCLIFVLQYFGSLVESPDPQFFFLRMKLWPGFIPQQSNFFYKTANPLSIMASK